MLSKKWCIIFGCGLFVMFDLITTIILNMIFDGSYSELLYDRPGIAVVLCLIGIPCCVHYVKKEFGKEVPKEQ